MNVSSFYRLSIARKPARYSDKGIGSQTFKPQKDGNMKIALI